MAISSKTNEHEQVQKKRKQNNELTEYKRLTTQAHNLSAF